MIFFTDPVRGSLQWIIAPAGLFLLFLPVICMASTPPVQPSLLFEISDLSAGESAIVVLSVTWNGYVSFNKPPEQIIEDVFSMPDGSRLGSFPLSKEDPCISENTCMYRRSVQADYFPSGTYMLIASDPLSDATSRQMISLHLHTRGYSEFFTHFAQERVFLLSSAILGTFLGVILALQTGQKR
jgi:hypothetical protein